MTTTPAPTPRALAQNPDGTWSPAEPIGFQGPWPDFEVGIDRDGRHTFHAYEEATLLATGRHRTRLGRRLAMARVRRRYARQAAERDAADVTVMPSGSTGHLDDVYLTVTVGQGNGQPGDPAEVHFLLRSNDGEDFAQAWLPLHRVRAALDAAEQRAAL